MRLRKEIVQAAKDKKRYVGLMGRPSEPFLTKFRQDGSKLRESNCMESEHRSSDVLVLSLSCEKSGSATVLEPLP